MKKLLLVLVVFSFSAQANTNKYLCQSAKELTDSYFLCLTNVLQYELRYEHKFFYNKDRHREAVGSLCLYLRENNLPQKTNNLSGTTIHQKLVCKKI